MAAVLLVTRSVVRRQWRSLVAVTLLIGIAGAVVLAAAAGARRTSTSLERFRTYSRAADLELDLDAATPEQLAALRRDPAVAAVGVLRQVTMVFPSGGLVPAAAAVDGTFGNVVDRPRVLAGRLPRPSSVHELAIGEDFATKLHLDVGDSVTFPSYSVEQIEQIQAGGDQTVRPQGPTVRFDIVGVVRRPLDLGVSGGYGGVIAPTPAFNDRYRDTIGGFVNVLLRVRAQDGATDVPRIVQAARRIFGDSLFQVGSVNTETEGARNAIDVLTAALWIFAAVAALAGAMAVAIVTFRQVGNVERDQEMLAALGLTARQRATAAGSVAVFAAIVGGVFAVCAAALTSPMFPMGLARKAEVDPGFRIDGRVLGLGLVAIVAFVASVAAIASWRVAVSVTRDRDARAVRRPSTVTRAAANAGASPVLTTGLRMALEPGRGATAVPLRSAFMGAVLGTLGIAAVLVFGASLDHLVATPRLYGWSWDTVVLSAHVPRPGATTACTDVTTQITHDRAFSAVASICQESVEVDGHPLTGWGFRSLRGSIDPAVVAGRAPRAADEVALGAAALDDIGKDVGAVVRVRGEAGTRRFRVVGRVALPALSTESPEALADGAAFTESGFVRLFPRVAVPNITIVARLAANVDREEVRRNGIGYWKFDSGVGLRPSVPVEVDRLRQVDNLPIILGGLLGFLATVAVAHAIVLSTRRRRRDLAVLRTIGFRRREVRATIASQATILTLLGLLVGVPFGIAIGRAVWRGVAEGVGVSPVADVPTLMLLAVAVVALLVMNVIGAFAATSAIRDRPSAALSTE